MGVGIEANVLPTLVRRVVLSPLRVGMGGGGAWWLPCSRVDEAEPVRTVRFWGERMPPPLSDNSHAINPSLLHPQARIPTTCKHAHVHLPRYARTPPRGCLGFMI